MATANHLIGETSPYLLQHAYNPVEWYPWGPEALGKAKAENKPILLSIGYAACHWCHVMEHESFEDPATAALMNRSFVPIKVDREERPDLDSIYMDVVTAMTGHGGWPMTVFLTPDLVPFYAGTYFPPTDRHGLPGFQRVLTDLAEAWQNRPQDVASTVASVREYLQNRTLRPAPEVLLTPDLLDRAFQAATRQFDATNGGFGRAPKFPQPMILEFLLRYYHRTNNPRALHMVELTLDKMARGGVYDQLGGGFHRYAVDAIWLVPHFEKMLYDNAQLARIYLEAYQVTGNAFYRQVAEETLDYVLREMTAAEGGFYATLDADSEGVEGKFYVWSPAEIERLLGEKDALLFDLAYGVTTRGNFEGQNILQTVRTPEEVAAEAGVPVEAARAAIERGRRLLLEARAKRVWPARDEKVLTAWNGLMIHALAEAGRVLDRDDYRAAAAKAADFVLDTLERNDRLLRTYKDGIAKLNGYLEDYAFLAEGLLALYEATFDLRWFREAARLARSMLAWFWEDAVGGFYDTSSDHEELITRPRDLYDNATPAGSSVAAAVLLRLYAYTGDDELHRRARSFLAPLAEAMAEQPLAFGRLLDAFDRFLAAPEELALVGDPAAPDTQALLRIVSAKYLPNLVQALSRGPGDPAEQAIPILADRAAIDGKATAYLCRAFACKLPTTDPAELERQLSSFD